MPYTKEDREIIKGLVKAQVISVYKEDYPLSIPEHLHCGEDDALIEQYTDEIKHVTAIYTYNVEYLWRMNISVKRFIEDYKNAPKYFSNMLSDGGLDY